MRIKRRDIGGQRKAAGRFLLLLATVVACGLGVVGLTVWLPGRGQSYADRLVSHWQFGTLQVNGPSTGNLRSLDFQVLKVSSDPGCESLITLSRGSWQRGTILPRPFGIDLAEAEVVFASGEVRLSERDDGVWSCDPLFVSGRARWFEQLPGGIEGNALQVEITPSGRPPLRLRLDQPRLRRDAKGLTIGAALLGDSWGEANLSWWVPAPGAADPAARFVARFDDADLSRFPFGELARVAPFPWPVDLPEVSGRVDLDWRVEDGQSSIEARHYQIALDLGKAGLGDEGLGVTSTLRYLSGIAVFSPQQVRWTIDTAQLSQSRLRGELEVDLLRRQLAGSVQLDGWITDRSLLPTNSPMWGILRSVPLSGEGLLDLTLDGALSDSWLALVRRAVFSFENLSLQGEETQSSFSGRMTLSPGPAAAWDVRVELDRARLGTLALPDIRAQGTFSGRAISLATAGEAPRKFEIQEEADGALSFLLELPEFQLPEALGLDLGLVAMSLHLSGEYRQSTGLTFDLRLTWRDLEVPASLSWPGPRPIGPVAGELMMKRQKGRYHLDWLVVWDAATRWEVAGEIGRDGHVALSGFSVEDRAWGAYGTQGGDAFEIRGPIFDWQIVPRAR